MRLPKALLTLTFLLAFAGPNTAAAQNASQEITENDVIACTHFDAAMAYSDAIKKGDQDTIGRFLSEEVCSRFGSISYRPMRIIRVGIDQNDPHIVHAKVFHLMDLYVITTNSFFGHLAR